MKKNTKNHIITLEYPYKWQKKPEVHRLEAGIADLDTTITVRELDGIIKTICGNAAPDKKFPEGSIGYWSNGTVVIKIN